MNAMTLSLVSYLSTLAICFWRERQLFYARVTFTWQVLPARSCPHWRNLFCTKKYSKVSKKNWSEHRNMVQVWETFPRATNKLITLLMTEKFKIPLEVVMSEKSIWLFCLKTNKLTSNELFLMSLSLRSVGCWTLHVWTEFEIPRE